MKYYMYIWLDGNGDLLLIRQTPRNELQWKFAKKKFIEENEFKNIICHMTASLSVSQCVKAVYMDPCISVTFKASVFMNTSSSILL